MPRKKARAKKKTSAKKSAAKKRTALTSQVLKLDDKRLRKEMRERMTRFTELMHDNVPKARQALRKLLNGPVKLTPVVKDGRKTYQLEGERR